jgi:hypothetical protein
MRALARNAPLVPDRALQQLASECGPGSTESYILLEPRETRSAGDDVCAYLSKGRYTVTASPLDPERSDTSSGDLS